MNVSYYSIQSNAAEQRAGGCHPPELLMEPDGARKTICNHG